MKRRGGSGRFERTLTERICEHAACGKQFLPRSSTQRFCGKPCMYAARRGAWSGTANPRFRGGLSQNKTTGRWLIVCRDYSLVLFYRAVMEAHLRRHLRSVEIVHHINGDPTDDRLENLELTTRSEHVEMHRAELNAARGNESELVA